MNGAQRAHLEHINAMNDHRECDPAEAPVLYLEDGTEKTLPMKWALCSVCNGNGSHVNPSIDSGGLSAEDFDEDPDFAESYMSGAYDQTCNKCRGRTTVPVVDVDRLSPEDLAAYGAQERSAREIDRMEYYERARGA